MDVKNILGYRVYRKAAFEHDFQPIYVTPEDSSEYVDKNVQFEIRYTYQITVLGEDFESNPSDTVSIIPGPTSIWFTDLYGRNLIRLTHDCMHEIPGLWQSKRVFNSYGTQMFCLIECYVLT